MTQDNLPKKAADKTTDKTSDKTQNSISDMIENWVKGPATVTADMKIHLSERDGTALHDKMRQAYWWIINNAVICPYYDIEFGQRFEVSTKNGIQLNLPGSMSYSSYVLIPLLTLFTCRKALMIGGPGRGKTTSSVLMSVLAGMSPEDIRRSILRGHPQLSVSDLLGAPLPSDLVKAEDAKDVKVSWRKWISSRVKIIDEYNRIPTKTQSSLLSLMSDGYAEMFDQYVYAGKSSWFLTANDDAGGGTFQVIEALKDRIDVVVRAVPFNSGFIDVLLGRIESGINPEDVVPKDIIFSESELKSIGQAIQKIVIPKNVLDELGFFLGQLDFCQRASPDFEYLSKDTLHLSGRTVASVCNEECPLDKKKHLCTQTENGTSARAYMTCIHFAKALAYFRGMSEVSWEDLRQIVPWVLHEKLKPNTRSEFFESAENQMFLQDRVAWIRNMMDESAVQYEATAKVRVAIQSEKDTLNMGLDGVSAAEVKKRQERILKLMKEFADRYEFSGYSYEMLQQLKSYYSRYQNYAHWMDSTTK